MTPAAASVFDDLVEPLVGPAWEKLIPSAGNNPAFRSAQTCPRFPLRDMSRSGEQRLVAALQTISPQRIVSLSSAVGITPQLDSFFSDAAQIALRQSLARRLQNTGRQVFEWTYKIFLQTPGLPSRVSFLEETAAVGSHYFPDGLERETQRFLESHPELARLWNLQVEAWLVFAGEILSHSRAFVGDASSPVEGEVTRLLDGASLLTSPATSSPGTVADLQMDLADLHNGNRSVARFTFSNGETWYYKPRSGEGEKAWFDLLQWLNDEGFSTPFQIVRVVLRENHSWMEAVESRPCENETEVEAFYFRAGALLHIYYLLGGMDLHSENLIAAGPQPVIIDCETLFHPTIEDPGWSMAIEKSVLRCGLLPAIYSDDVPRIHLSALGCEAEGEHNVRLGTKQMHLFDYREGLLAGYEKMHDFLKIRRNRFDAMAEKLSLLSWRCVRRPTRDYADFLEQSLSVNGLRDRRQTLADQLRSSPDSAQEIASLLAGDIPFFHQPGDLTMLQQGDALEVCLRFIRQTLEKNCVPKP